MSSLHLFSSSFKPPSSDEVVEDSEPEREERRRELAARKKKLGKRRHNPPSNKGLSQAAVVPTPVVVDISDDDPSPSIALPPETTQSLPPAQGLLFSGGAVSRNAKPGHISISDGPSSGSGSGSSTRLNSDPVARGPLKTGFLANTSSSGLIVGSPPAEVDERPFDLSRFAFQSSSRSSSIAPSARSYSTAAKALPKPSSKANKEIIEINEATLKKINKCPCCDLTWTVRKTAPQKLKHIRTCAKKNQITSDTIHHLVAKHIEAAASAASASKEGASCSTPAAPNTLLGEAMQEPEPAPKKGSRRPAVVETVKSITDTREDILARARLLLGPGQGLKPPSTAASPLKTQPFGESALARLQKVKSSLLDDSYVQPHIATPMDNRSALKEPLGPAEDHESQSDSEIFFDWDPTPPRHEENDRSHGLKPTSSHANYDDFEHDVTFLATHSDPPEEELVYTPSIPEGTPGRPKKQISVSSESERVQSPRSTRRKSKDTRRRSSVLSPGTSRRPLEISSDELSEELCDVGWSDCDNADGIMHFMPESDLAPFRASPKRNSLPQSVPFVTTPSSQLSFPVKKTRTKTAQKITKRTQDLPSSSNSLINPTPRKPRSVSPSRPAMTSRTKKSKGKRVATTVDDPTTSFADEELFVRLRDHILADSTLHLQILRYEPIDFNVFMKIAMDFDAPERNLKYKVRAFLDKLAIHYYGFTEGRGTRRVRA